MSTLTERVHALDEAIERWLEPRRTPTLDHLFYGLSSAADHGLLWHGIGVARALRRRDPGYALRFSAVLGVESAITNVAVKSLFRRVRPPDHFEDDAPLPYGMRRPITSSFPSGHAATAFMCASVLSGDDGEAPAWYALASLVAASRVYVRMHHASDVVGGAVLGLVLGRLARRFLT
jgi:undecaprenyl-diphosphatase